MASKEMIIYVFLGVLIAMGLAVGYPKLSAQLLISKITSTTDLVGTLRTISKQYIAVNDTQDLQNITIEELDNKNLVPSNFSISGTGAASYMLAPFDKKIRLSLSDPNSGTASAGNSVQITVDAANLGLGTKDRQIWEDTLKRNIEAAGGSATGYDASGADGVINAIFE